MKKLLLIMLLLTSTVYAQDTSKVAQTMDQLIQKYSPDIKTGFEKMYDFTKVKGEQAIEIFYRYLLIQDIFYLSISIIFLIAAIVVYKFLMKHHKEDEYAGYDIWGYIIISAGTVICSISIFINTYNLLLLLFVPEVRLLQEILCLIKNN